jgi:hypothetical protein
MFHISLTVVFMDKYTYYTRTHMNKFRWLHNLLAEVITQYGNKQAQYLFML